MMKKPPLLAFADAGLKNGHHPDDQSRDEIQGLEDQNEKQMMGQSG
jgi:hypothetical protein